MLSAARAELGERRDVLAAGGACIGLAAALGLGTAIAPALAVAATGGLLFVAVVLRSLAAGLALFIVVTFFDRVTPLTAAGLSPVKLAGLVLAAGWALLMLDRAGRVPVLLRAHPYFASCVLVFATWALASTMWAPDPVRALSASGRLILVVVLVFILFTAVRDRQHVRWIVGAFLVGALGAQLVGISGVYSADAGNDGRFAGGFDDPNELAAVLVPAMTLAGFALVVTRRAFARAALLGGLGLFGVALIRTDSQAGIVALVAALLLAIVFSGSARRQVVIAVSAFVVFATFYYTVVTSPVLLETITSSENVGARESLWSVAGEVAAENPVLGIGAGNFVTVSAAHTLTDVNLPRFDYVLKGGIVHNTWLEILAELGPIGLASILAVVVTSLTLGVRAVRAFEASGDRELEMLSRGVVIATVAMLTAATFATATYEKQLWLLVGLGPVLASLAARAPARVLEDGPGDDAVATEPVLRAVPLAR